MNQQRSRRFRAAKEAKAEAAKDEKKFKDSPIPSRFDGNAITPGRQ